MKTHTGINPESKPSGTVRRVPCDGRLVVAPASMRGVRTHRLLRQFTQPARLSTCHGDWSPHRR
jgi:hypothetical protein